jgi:hypothetical protein
LGTDPAVEAWFKDLDHPLKDVMLRVRSIVLGVDDRVEEAIKWKSPTFMFRATSRASTLGPRSKST